MLIAVTGHRSEKCKSEESVRNRVRPVLDAFRPEFVIVGMANGVDLWTGDVALELGIPVWAALPWQGHKPRRSDVELYSKVIENAGRISVVHEGLEYPGPWVYFKRNQFMVDNATHVLGYLNPQAKSGGTFQCWKYAKESGKPRKNVYEVITR